MIPTIVPRRAQNWELKAALFGVALLSSVALISFTCDFNGGSLGRRLPEDEAKNTASALGATPGGGGSTSTAVPLEQIAVNESGADSAETKPLLRKDMKMKDSTETLAPPEKVFQVGGEVNITNGKGELSAFFSDLIILEAFEAVKGAEKALEKVDSHIRNHHHKKIKKSKREVGPEKQLVLDRQITFIEQTCDLLIENKKQNSRNALNKAIVCFLDLPQTGKDANGKTVTTTLNQVIKDRYQQFSITCKFLSKTANKILQNKLLKKAIEKFRKKVLKKNDRMGEARRNDSDTKMTMTLLRDHFFDATATSARCLKKAYGERQSLQSHLEKKNSNLFREDNKPIPQLRAIIKILQTLPKKRSLEDKYETLEDAYQKVDVALTATKRANTDGKFKATYCTTEEKLDVLKYAFVEATVRSKAIPLSRWELADINGMRLAVQKEKNEKEGTILVGSSKTPPGEDGLIITAYEGILSELASESPDLIPDEAENAIQSAPSDPKSKPSNVLARMVNTDFPVQINGTPRRGTM